eukprot:6728217-Pyramimonas_sp.AAC.1
MIWILLHGELLALCRPRFLWRHRNYLDPVPVFAAGRSGAQRIHSVDQGALSVGPMEIGRRRNAAEGQAWRQETEGRPRDSQAGQGCETQGQR